jgi:hypothetical protein
MIKMTGKREKGTASVEFARMLSRYFRGIFFQSPDKDLFLPYLLEGGRLDLKKMAGRKPFESLFPRAARAAAPEGLWRKLEDFLSAGKKDGGFVRLFIEDQDDVFLLRTGALVSPKKFRRDDYFSIPGQFFENLSGSGVYLSLKEYPKNNKEKSRKTVSFTWDFEYMVPPVAHTLKKHERPVSIYDAFEWYGESQYTRLFLGNVFDPDENDPYLLIKTGGEKCIEEILKAYCEYREKNYNTSTGPSGDFILLIYEALETPHGALKDMEEIKKIVFGGIKRRNIRNESILSKTDRQNIKNAVKDTALLLDRETRQRLEDRMRDGAAGAAAELRKLFTTEPLQGKIDPKRINTINGICIKLEEGNFSLGTSAGPGEKPLEELVADKTLPAPEDMLFDNWKNSAMLEFLEGDFKSLCVDKGLRTIFAGEDQFIGYMAEKPWREIADLLLPYTSSAPATESALFDGYCRVSGIETQNREETQKLHTVFKTKIRRIFDIIRKQAPSRLKKVMI